jgi:hypothetical protein
MARFTLVSIALLLAVAGTVVLAFSISRDASAEGPCGTPHDAMDEAEFAFLGLLQDWRDAGNIPYSSQLTPSGPLNAAAAWFAEWQVEHESPGGHGDDLGRDFIDRAQDCGWPFGAGIGEGIAAYVGGGDISGLVSHQGALQLMADHVGSGIYAWSGQSSGFAFKCVGVGIARNEDFSAIAWIVLIAQFPAGQECLEPQSQPVVSDPSITPSPSPSPTPTQTPVPTPDSWQSWVPGVTTE